MVYQTNPHSPLQQAYFGHVYQTHQFSYLLLKLLRTFYEPNIVQVTGPGPFSWGWPAKDHVPGKAKLRKLQRPGQSDWATVKAGQGRVPEHTYLSGGLLILPWEVIGGNCLVTNPKSYPSLLKINQQLSSEKNPVNISTLLTKKWTLESIFCWLIIISLELQICYRIKSVLTPTQF